MTRVADLNAEFAKLSMLEGRSPTTTAAERREAISRLLPYRDGAVFAAKFSGKGAWERHPQGDEIVHIVEGKTSLHLITGGGQTVAAVEGRYVGGCSAKRLASVRVSRWRLAHDHDATADRKLGGGCR
jgi:uncharacterized cupin superfamily protein